MLGSDGRDHPIPLVIFGGHRIDFQVHQLLIELTFRDLLFLRFLSLLLLLCRRLLIGGGSCGPGLAQGAALAERLAALPGTGGNGGTCRILSPTGGNNLRIARFLESSGVVGGSHHIISVVVGVGRSPECCLLID